QDGLQRFRRQRLSGEPTEHVDFKGDETIRAREALQEHGLKRRVLESRRLQGPLPQGFDTQSAFVGCQVPSRELEQFSRYSWRRRGPVEHERPSGRVEIEKVVPVLPELLDYTR